MPSVLVDAVAVPGGAAAAKVLGRVGHAAEFIVNAYRHCKPILALGAACAFLENAGVPRTLPSGEPDPGLLMIAEDATASALPAFMKAIARHRHFEREMDPPPV
jgi:catalase